MQSTYFGLLAEFGTAEVPLEQICEKYFGMNSRKAKQRAAMRQLPIPTYHAGSQKSPWLVSITDLAEHIDKRKAEAKKEFERVNS